MRYIGIELDSGGRGGGRANARSIALVRNTWPHVHGASPPDLEWSPQYPFLGLFVIRYLAS